MRKKLIRYAENANRDNVIEPGKQIHGKIKGKWNELFFKNERPITVELGCGDGEYTIGLAGIDNERNYVGVDIKGDRLYQGSTLAIEKGYENVAFLRTQMHMLDQFFNEGEVDEFWLTFPDPRPKKGDVRRRLTCPRYLNIYQKLCRPDGMLKFKTDSTSLFDYTIEVLESEFEVENLEYTRDLYTSDMLVDHHGIKTKYEQIWSEKGELIKYLKFNFKQ